MDFAFLDGLGWAPWLPVFAAYLFGGITGWLIWGGRDTDEDEALSARDRVRQKAAVLQRDVGDIADDSEATSIMPIENEVPDAMKIGALESELRKSRELLSQYEAEQKSADEQLTNLDTTLIRANGRLKLLIGAVKKAAAQR